MIINTFITNIFEKKNKTLLVQFYLKNDFEYDMFQSSISTQVAKLLTRLLNVFDFRSQPSKKSDPTDSWLQKMSQGVMNIILQ